MPPKIDMNDLGKIEIVLKDPDAVTEAVREYLDQISDDERIREVYNDAIMDKINTIFEWGEYLTVLVDLDKMTAKIVIPGEVDESEVTESNRQSK